MQMSLFSSTVQSQSKALPSVTKCFGVTPPISVDLPEEADLMRTRNMIDMLTSYDIFEGDLELQHIEKVIEKVESVYKEWLTETCLSMNLPEVVTAKVGGKIFPFGSYHLGAHMKRAKIDALCVGPGFLERKEFFTSFYQKLQAQKEVQSIWPVEEAFVPAINVIYDGIEMDLVFARVERRSITKHINLLDDKFVTGVDEHCVRSLNGYRLTEEILRNVPNPSNFRLTFRAIYLWAKRRNISSDGLGFLGGISWAIMVARICQVYPNATASTLVNKFFKVYDMWEWPIPIALKKHEYRVSKLPVWDPRRNPGDRAHLMPIISPAYPEQNSACNVTRCTLAIMNEEFKRGFTITEDIRQNKESWTQLFEISNLYEQCKYVLHSLRRKRRIYTLTLFLVTVYHLDIFNMYVCEN
uniref:poly(A) polymerase type 3-like n=1 Tax=Semicossyphus pulcher TaxID=241346 RepID=UPI0037E9AF03